MNTVIPFPGLTDAALDAWLDAYPGRRAAFERHGPERRAEERARVARMLTLQSSPMATDLAAVVERAEALRASARDLVSRYRPDEASHVLVAAGLPLPHPHAIVQGSGGDAFEEPRALCASLAATVGEFLREIDAEARTLLPASEPAPPAAPQPPAPDPDPSAILVRAREQLAWRPFFSAPDMTDADRESCVQERARDLALSESPIGRAAIAVSGALDALLYRIDFFLENWPDSNSAEEAGKEALDAAGLKEPAAGLRGSACSDTYNDVAGELERWQPMLQLMSDLTRMCQPFDTRTGPDATDEPRAAA